MAAYLLGAVPFGKLIAQRAARLDITGAGSGNIGATNVARTVGLKWGLLTLFLDMMKGFLPVAAFSFFSVPAYPHREGALALVALAALVGHQFSVFLKGRGGKGAATALGTYLALSPLSCVGALVVFVVLVWRWDYISLGSMVSAFSIPLFMTFFGKPGPLVAGALIGAVLISARHKDNLRRLLRGEERKWRSQGNQVRSPSNLSNSSSE